MGTSVGAANSCFDSSGKSSDAVIAVIEKAAAGTVGGVGTRRIYAFQRIGWLREHCEAVKIGPALAHAPRHVVCQAGTIAVQPVRKAVGELMNYEARVQRAVYIGRRTVPDIHLQAGPRAVARSRKVGVIDIPRILPFGPYAIAAHALPCKIHILKITRGLSKAKSVSLIVVPVGGVKKLRNRALLEGRSGIRLT